jgi:predicted Zn-dependent protease
MTALTQRAYFEQLAAGVCQAAASDERVSLHLVAEASDFLRFNQAAVRQATHVTQAHATVAVVRGQRSAESTLALSGDHARDTRALNAERDRLLRDLAQLPEDPYLLLPDTVVSTTREDHGVLPEPAEVMDAVRQHACGLDLVGFYAGGPMVRAFADSRGQRNWHKVEAFTFEWCLYHAADKAVKTSYAGARWEPAEFARRVDEAAQRVKLLEHAPRTLAPGAYRTYFAPAAAADLVGMLGWGGFSLKARQTGTSSLMRLVRGDAALHAGVQIEEATGRSMAAAFTAKGFTRPESVALVTNGRHAGSLVSPRSAREYGMATNGASAQETPEALSLGPGTLAEADVLKTLGTGLYLSNLHYLNYSDRQACRMTGMTRFACFWVENGELVAPLNVMRFDDDFLRLFGPGGLVALTRSTELLPETVTYGARQLSSVSSPGALVEGFTLTL